MDTRRYYNEQVLAHASHKYITRKWKNGKWVYTYPNDKAKTKSKVEDVKKQKAEAERKAAEQARLEAEKKRQYDAERKANIAAAGKARQEAGLKDAEKKAAEEAKPLNKAKRTVEKGKEWLKKAFTDNGPTTIDGMRKVEKEKPPVIQFEDIAIAHPKGLTVTDHTTVKTLQSKVTKAEPEKKKKKKKKSN